MHKRLLHGVVLGFLTMVSLQPAPVKHVIMQNDDCCKKVCLYSGIHGLGTQQQRCELFMSFVDRLQSPSNNPNDYAVLVESLKSKTVPTSLSHLSLDELIQHSSFQNFDFLNLFSLYQRSCPCLMYDITPSIAYAWDDLNKAFIAMQNAYDLFELFYYQEKCNQPLHDNTIVFNQDIDGYILQAAKQRVRQLFHQRKTLSLQAILGKPLATRVLALTYRDLCIRIITGLNAVAQSKYIGEIDDNGVFSDLYEDAKRDCVVFKQQLMDLGFNEQEAENTPIINLFVRCAEEEFGYDKKPKTNQFCKLITEMYERPLLGYLMQENNPLFIMSLIEVNALECILSCKASNVVVFAGAEHVEVLEGLLKQCGFTQKSVLYASKKGGTSCKSDQDICNAFDDDSLLPLPSTCFDCLVSPEQDDGSDELLAWLEHH